MNKFIGSYTQLKSNLVNQKINYHIETQKDGKYREGKREQSEKSNNHHNWRPRKNRRKKASIAILEGIIANHL